MTTEGIVSSLEGATIKVSSVDASSSLLVSDVEIANTEDVTIIMDQAMEAAASSCVCNINDYDTEIKDIINSSYVTDLQLSMKKIIVSEKLSMLSISPCGRERLVVREDD